MGLLKTDKLAKGERGLVQALKKNKKFVKRNDHTHMDVALETALEYRRQAKEGFAMGFHTGQSPLSPPSYRKTGLYKKGDLFVWKQEDGFISEDRRMKKFNTSYYIIQKNKEGRYEISSFDINYNIPGKPIGTLKLRIGTDDVKQIFDMDLRHGKYWGITRMTQQDDEEYVRVLKAAHQLDVAEAEFKKQTAARKSKPAKGQQAEAQKEAETPKEAEAPKEAEPEAAKEEVNAQEEEMGL